MMVRTKSKRIRSRLQEKLEMTLKNPTMIEKQLDEKSFNDDEKLLI